MRLRLVTALAAVLIVGQAHAQTAPVVAKKKVGLRAFRAKASEPVVKNGATKTRGQIVDMFDADTKITLPSGKSITVQELVDAVEDAEAQLQQKGSTLAKLPKKTWMKPTTPAKITTQKTALAGELAALRAGPRPKTTGGSSSGGCTATTCTPKDKEESVRWEKQKGDEDIAAAYTSFTVGERTPDAFNASCNATWDNGVYVLGDKRSLVRFVTDLSAKTSSSPTFSAKTSLYVLGQSSPIWTKSGKIDGDSLDRTFKSPRVRMGYSIVPLVTLEGGIDASSTLGLKPRVGGSATKTGTQCSLGITPRLVAGVNPDVKLTIGVPKLAEIAEGGVRATLEVLDARMPTNVNVSLAQSPLSLDLAFKSEVQASFLKGRLVGWYRIKDICAFGYCLVEDGLGISTSGEIDLWESDGFEYRSTLADIKGPIAFETTSGVIDPMR